MKHKRPCTIKIRGFFMSKIAPDESVTSLPVSNRFGCKAVSNQGLFLEGEMKCRECGIEITESEELENDGLCDNCFNDSMRDYYDTLRHPDNKPVFISGRLM